MDGFSSLAAATSLLQQAFHLFRYVSSARSFAESAGTLSAMMAVEFFRFETWLQQSGLLSTDLSTGNLVVHEISLRRSLLLAAEMQSLTMEYERVERHVLAIIGQVYHCLQQLEKLRSKYSLGAGDLVDSGNAPDVAPPVTTSAIPGVQPLFRNSRVANAVSNDLRSRQRRAKVVSFFRKVNFAWSLSEDTSDKEKIIAHVQTLKYCNDTLRECLPPVDRQIADQLVNLKALSLSSQSSDLKGIGKAANGVHGPVYTQIYEAVMLKARRADVSSLTISEAELKEMEIDIGQLETQDSLRVEDADRLSTPTNRRALAKYSAASITARSTTLLEWSSFSSTLPDDDIELLKERIATLCTFLKSAGHPYFSMLPVCEGFIHHNRTTFALAYQLPPFAVPNQPPCSLYSILPRNKHSIDTEKAGNNTTGRGLLPSLEQRYQLAASLTEGLLSLLGVDWVHKALNSHNVALYHSRLDTTTKLDFSSPQFLGFGVARRERPGERTIDLRDGDTSPWRFWLHPELQTAGGDHRRFERRFDVYALGLVLFEIGMWQDLHYYCSGCASAEELRRRVVHVCAREMAHRMGEAYKGAVMACLDGDEMWRAAVEEGVSGGEKTSGVYGEGEFQGMTFTELFFVNVFSVLKSRTQAS